MITLYPVTKKDFPNGKTVSYQYHSNSYYDVRMEQTASGWNCTIQLQPLAQPFEKQLVEEIFQEYKKGSESYVAKWNKQEAAVIVFQKMDWNNTLLIHDLYVEESFKNRGIGQYLMNYVKQRAHEINVRAIVLETQTSNVPAIQFYLKNGFALGGLNTISYTNEDIKNKEVRIEMAYTM